MTTTDREIWRAAYDLYEWNYTMLNNDTCWTSFLQSVTDFANHYDWQNHPLTRRLAFALIDVIEDEVKSRAAENLSRPQQITLFQVAT